LFLIISSVLSSYYSLQWATNRDLPKKFITYIYQENGSRIPATWFNKAIAYYIAFTSFAGITLFFLDNGKLWSTFATLHNFWEVCILLLLSQGGKITSNFFYAFVGFYVFIVNVLNIVLPWPMDALWFKMQGMERDIYIFIYVFYLFIGQIIQISSFFYKVFVRILHYLSYLFVFTFLHKNMLKNNHQLNFLYLMRMIFLQLMKNQAFHQKSFNTHNKFYYYFLHLLFISWEILYL